MFLNDGIEVSLTERGRLVLYLETTVARTLGTCRCYDGRISWRTNH